MKAKAFASILDERKSDIVTAVLKLVDKVGVTGLTTKRIAKEVGFAEGALYKHVESKADIYHLILDSAIRMVEGTFQDISRKGLDPEAALRAWFAMVITFLEDYPGIYRIVFSDALYAADRALFRRFKDCLSDLQNRVRLVIERGMAEKVFRPDLDPASNALMYLGVIHMTFSLWTVLEERSRSYKKTAEPFIEEFLLSLRVPSREARRG
jgi:AcrR family transcriptional regulator